MADAQNELSVAESAGNVVAKVAKAEDAQTQRCDVELEPAWRSAEATTMADNVTDNAQNALSAVESAGNVVAKVAKAEDAQNERSVLEPEPAWGAAAKLGKDKKSEPRLQAVA